MFNPKSLAKFGAAMTVAFAVSSALAAPAFAQDAGQTPSDQASGTVRGEQVLPGRIGGDRRNQQQQPPRQQRQRGPAPVAMTPEQAKEAAQVQATAAGVACQVTEANRLGENPEKQNIFEAACATGPGYILVSSTPPQAIDCVLLAGQAAIARSRDPAVDVGLQCVIEANKDVLKVISAYAVEAGIPCAIDQGTTIGKSSEGNVIYEVGCPAADGYWIEKTGSTWKTTSCLVIVTQSGTCQFTTPAEQNATVKAWFASSEASACDVTGTRYMGANANGSFYELKCASGDGFIGRLDNAMAVQQVYKCAEAASIGGGCKLDATPTNSTGVETTKM